MKAGDDYNQKARRRFINEDKPNRFENWLLLLVVLYFGGHLTYYLWRTA